MSAYVPRLLSRDEHVIIVERLISGDLDEAHARLLLDVRSRVAHQVHLT